MDLSFYKGKKVFITGHTGFKGAWLAFMLLEAGAEVTGYSLEAPTVPSLYKLCKLGRRMESVIGDIRDYKNLNPYITSLPYHPWGTIRSAQIIKIHLFF